MKSRLLVFLLTNVIVFSGYAQTNLITGKVIAEEDSIPLSGVTVSIKNSSVSTLTDLQGRFNIQISNSRDTLIFSMLGRQSTFVQAGNQAIIDVTLTLVTTPLNEVVVIGYGNQLRHNLTGSISSIPEKQLQDVPLSTVDQALQGRASGAWVTQNSGTPGSSVKVRIRGINSLNAGAEPLYVIDGMPITANDYSIIYTGGQSINPLSDLNPSDIASIEVLKDAAATAIYGSRGSNGVVLITTKHGKNAPMAIDFNMYEGLQQAPKMLDRISGPELEALINEQRAAINQAPRYPDPENATTTDWQREVFQTAPIREYSLSASGGNKLTRFLLSGTYFQQQGIVIGSEFQRGSFRVNLDHQANQKLRVGTNLNLSRSLNDRINGDNFINGVLSSAFFLGSHIPIYNPDGTYALDPFSSIANPVAEGKEAQIAARSTRILGTLYAEYSFTPFLIWRITVGLDNKRLKEDLFYPNTTFSGTSANGSGRSIYGEEFNWLLENTLTYTFHVRDHSFSALVGAGFQEWTFDGLSAAGTNFPGNSISHLAAASVKTAASSEGSEWALTSFFTRLNYAFRNKLLLSLTARADGSSRFPSGEQYGVFPVGSIGYIILEGDESSSQSILSFFKTRISYGMTGNNNIGSRTNQTPGLATFGIGENYVQQTGLVPQQLANPELTWEKTTELNVGVDAGLMSNRLHVTSNYFVRNTHDLLQSRLLPQTSGFISISENIGSLKNEGVEFEVGYSTLPHRAFQWSSNFNLSFIQNEVTKLNEGTPFTVGYANWVQEGQPIGAFYGYRVERIFQAQSEIDALNQSAREIFGANAFYQSSATRPGDIAFKDVDGDGRITSTDQVVIGCAQPDFYGGFNNTFTFHNFDASVFFQFSYGNEIYNSTRSVGEGMNTQYGQFTSVRDRWTVENPSTSMPRAVQGDPNGNRRTSDRFLEDGSFLRLKNISIGYSIPNHMLRKIRIRALRIYASSQNAYTWTNYSSYDPEVNSLTDQSLVFGNDFQVMPQPRTFHMGMLIGL